MTHAGEVYQRLGCGCAFDNGSWDLCRGHQLPWWAVYVDGRRVSTVAGQLPAAWRTARLMFGSDHLTLAALPPADPAS